MWRARTRVGIGATAEVRVVEHCPTVPKTSLRREERRDGLASCLESRANGNWYGSSSAVRRRRHFVLSARYTLPYVQRSFFPATIWAFGLLLTTFGIFLAQYCKSRALIRPSWRHIPITLGSLFLRKQTWGGAFPTACTVITNQARFPTQSSASRYLQ
jgi:hypothetical protein